jgi:hypothetical protein
MSGWAAFGKRRSTRRLTATLEPLDSRVLLSSSHVGHSLGPGLAPGQGLPRASSPAEIVTPHPAINQFLATELGSGVDTVEQRVEAQGLSANALVADQVLSNPFIHAVFSRQDTYTLLNSVASATLSVVPTGETDQQDTVTFSIPSQATITSLGIDQTQLQVLPTPSSQGFFVNVPTANIRTNADGTATALVPRSAIPSGAAVPSASTVPTGALSDVFTSTGPVILSAFRSSVPRSGPNAPRAIPGLRLSAAFQHTASLPNSRVNQLLYAFRIAVDRNVFSLNSTQADAVNAGVSDFEKEVATLNQSGALQPSVPAPAAPIPRMKLGGTLAVSLGALRKLTNVDPSQTGLQLSGVGNFPGRIDVGYVFDRRGNFGVILTARGALASAPSKVATPDVVDGDIQVEVSNATSLSALTGTRSVEALNQGVGLSGGVAASRYTNGVSTFAASAGYGSGLEFGTGTAYTRVIPLGNVYSLIPSAPRS